MNKGRVLIIVFLMIIFCSILMVRLFKIQISDHDDLIFYAKRQQIKEKNVRAERGFIYDRNMDLLVYDRNDISFFINCRNINNKEINKIAGKFSSIFHKDASYYKNLIRSNKGELGLEKKVPRETALKLKDFTSGYLEVREDPTRIYSYDNLASHVLGYVGIEKYEGVEGIEKYYNKHLCGIDGKMMVMTDVWGRMISVSEEATVKPVMGNSIILTIDKTYQNILEEELMEGLTKYQSNSAVGIIMNPNNGEILAMAVMPDFNPNIYWEFSDEIRRDRILTDTYEPGSTFKAVSISLLLNEKLCKSSDMVYCENGDYKFKQLHIRDTHRFGMLTVKQVIEQSSNIGMSKLISRISDDDFFRYLRNYGFGNYTCIDLPGESKGLLKKPGTKKFNYYSKPFMSFGYEISVTPIQLITAYAALINGGFLYQPHLVREIVKRNGELVESFETKQLRRVINQETSSKLREFLAGVVENGTAKNAKSCKLTFGGKTGTSQKLNGNEYTTNYNSSFIGFFPVKNPKILCMLLYNSPKVGGYGGLVAAPVFRNIAERMVEFNPKLIQENGESNKREVKIKFDFEWTESR